MSTKCYYFSLASIEKGKCWNYPMLLLHYSKPVHTKSFNHFEHGDRKEPTPNILICKSIRFKGLDRKKKENEK